VNRRKKPFYEKVLIESIGAEGNAIARIENMVLFVPMLVPGDIADIQVTRKRKKYMEGRAVFIHKYSERRVDPVCEHFSVCGGCKWQHLSYPDQLLYKENQVIETLKRIGKISHNTSEPIIGSEKTEFYRNKLEYTFSSNKWFTREEIDTKNEFKNSNAAGFHIPGKFDRVLDINKCWLQEEPGNSIRNFIKRFAEKNNFIFYDTKNHRGFLRNLIIRNSSSNELMVIIIFAENKPDEIESLLISVKQNFPEITSLMYSINQKKNDTLYDQEIITFSGKDHIIEKLEDLNFVIGPKSFFQTNTNQALKLYRKVKEYAGFSGKETVYDLYTGTGTIANYVARDSEIVIGIDSVPEAISDAILNSKFNNIENTVFYAGDIKDVLNDTFFSEHGKPDIVITDPPRAGMHREVVRSILNAAPRRIIYVSCNPSTQARDILLLSMSYNVSKIQPLDMFPHTQHVENIVVLERK